MKRAVIIVSIAAAIRLIMAAIVPIVPDEAYYWEWSRHLAPGYFDHPPAIAWLIWMGTKLIGDSPLGVRFVPIIAGFLGSVVAVAITRSIGGGHAAQRTAVLLSVLPIAGIGLVLATPDVPLLASEAVALWAVCRVIAKAPQRRSSGETQQRRSGEAPKRRSGENALSYTAGEDPKWERKRDWGAERASYMDREGTPTLSPEAHIGLWIIAGLASGAAMSSKYTAVLLPAAIAIACAVSPVLRRQFRRPGPYLACVVAALVLLPVLLWNADHGWISFAFQLNHGLGHASGSVVGRELALIGGQAGLLTPILLPLMVIAVYQALRHPRWPRSFVLGFVSAFTWAFFLVSALRRPVEPNWPAVAVLPAVILLGVWRPDVRWAKWERAGAIFGVVVVIAVYLHAIRPWIPLAAPRDPIARAFGWDDLARAVTRDASPAQATGARQWIAADRYQDASELAFHLSGHPTVFALNMAGRPNQFDLWPTAGDSLRLGDGMVVVLDDVEGGGVPTPVARLSPHFASVVQGERVDLRWGSSRVVGRRRLWHFFNLTVPLPATPEPSPS